MPPERVNICILFNGEVVILTGMKVALWALLLLRSVSISAISLRIFSNFPFSSSRSLLRRSFLAFWCMIKAAKDGQHYKLSTAMLTWQSSKVVDPICSLKMWDWIKIMVCIPCKNYPDKLARWRLAPRILRLGSKGNVSYSKIKLSLQQVKNWKLHVTLGWLIMNK